MTVQPLGIAGATADAIVSQQQARQARDDQKENTTRDARNNQLAYSMIAIPPEDDQAARGRVVGELKKLAKTLDRTTFRDRGEKYFPIELLSPEEKDKLMEAEMQSHFKSLPGNNGTTPADKDDDDSDQ